MLNHAWFKSVAQYLLAVIDLRVNRGCLRPPFYLLGYPHGLIKGFCNERKVFCYFRRG